VVGASRNSIKPSYPQLDIGGGSWLLVAVIKKFISKKNKNNVFN